MASSHLFVAAIILCLSRPLVSMQMRFDSVTAMSAYNPCDIRYVLNFSGNLISSNLGGRGPDFTMPEAIIYENILPFFGYLDLEVTVSSGGYSPGNATLNGLVNSFGNINVMENSLVNLKFRFIDHSTRRTLGNPSPFYFSMFDLDTASVHEGVESVLVKNILSYKTSDDTELLVKPSGQYTQFLAQQVGTAADNPTNPNALTTQQMARMVSVLFPPGPEFEMTFKVVSGGSAARNFMFAGASPLVCPKRALCSSFTCPNGELKKDAAYLTCAGETCVSDDAPTCCCEVAGFAPFDPAGVIKSSIGEAIDGKIMFGNILRGVDAYMEVVALNDFSRINTKYSGLLGAFGILSILANSSIQFKFKFQNRADGAPWHVSPFQMSVMDLDHAAEHVWNEPECREEVFAQGATNFTLEPSSTVAVQYKNEEAHFVSGEVGPKDDNPFDPLKVSAEQKRKSVTFEFPSLAEFSLTFSVGSGCKHSRSISFTKPVINDGQC